MDVQAFVEESEVMKMNAMLAERRDFTVEDIESLPEGVRAELIDGQIFYFAFPKLVHQELLMKLSNVLYNYVEKNKGKCRTLFAPFGVLLVEDGKNYLEPDILVVCDENKLREDGCYGAPDLIIEVTSKSTKKRDYGIKLLKYRTAGVKEYWIVDPMRETVMVHWFEDEEQNCLYGMREEIPFHLFPDLSVRLIES
ncbi:MAG: Uma2 family endonuclease [Lachnoclostridium sp.]|nr:Uma2 family endonuclease [Lachnoclostridium sp.]